MIANAIQPSNTDAQALELAYRVRYATQQLDRGDAPAKVNQQVMMMYGVTHDDARQIVDFAWNERRRSEQVIERARGRDSGHLQVVVGSVLCLMALSTFVATGGGAIAVGASITGPILLIVGIVRATR